MIVEHHPAKSDKLCFLSEEELFTLIVYVNKTILAAFITHLVRHPEKRKLNSQPMQQCIVPRIIANFFETPCIQCSYVSPRKVY